jgi:hypothetical protein
MAVAASGQGGLLVRVDADQSAALLVDPSASLMEMRGRPMPGWIRVDSGGLTNDELATWVARGMSYARSLPAKT